MKVYDASGHILGRMSSIIAKELLNGENIVVVNAEKAVISGRPKQTLEHYKIRVKRGDPIKGPFFPRTPNGIFRRAIRGMLPWKKAKGQEAFKRLIVHIGVPENLEGKEEKFERIEQANAGKLNTRSVSIGDLSVDLGAKKRW